MLIITIAEVFSSIENGSGYDSIGLSLLASHSAIMFLIVGELDVTKRLSNIEAEILIGSDATVRKHRVFIIRLARSRGPLLSLLPTAFHISPESKTLHSRCKKRKIHEFNNGSS